MSKLLNQWDAGFPSELARRQRALAERRTFLANMVKSVAVAGTWPASSLTARFAQAQDEARLDAKREPWRSFAAVQSVLFPAEADSPGAMDINATAYLKFVLEAPDTDAEEREFILNGIDWLNGIANEQFEKPFVQLGSELQDKTLQIIVRSQAGESWLSYLLYYIFEALLADPVYGGNPDQIGWRWLHHQPGFPRPPADKTYQKLR